MPVDFCVQCNGAKYGDDIDFSNQHKSRKDNRCLTVIRNIDL